jgi:hypothetical protein
LVHVSKIKTYFSYILTTKTARAIRTKKLYFCKPLRDLKLKWEI